MNGNRVRVRLRRVKVKLRANFTRVRCFLMVLLTRDFPRRYRADHYINEICHRGLTRGQPYLLIRSFKGGVLNVRREWLHLVKLLLRSTIRRHGSAYAILTYLLVLRSRLPRRVRFNIQDRFLIRRRHIRLLFVRLLLSNLFMMEDR